MVTNRITGVVAIGMVSAMVCLLASNASADEVKAHIQFTFRDPDAAGHFSKTARQKAEALISERMARLCEARFTFWDFAVGPAANPAPTFTVWLQKDAGWTLRMKLSSAGGEIPDTESWSITLYEPGDLESRQYQGFPPPDDFIRDIVDKFFVINNPAQDTLLDRNGSAIRRALVTYQALASGALFKYLGPEKPTKPEEMVGKVLLAGTRYADLANAYFKFVGKGTTNHCVFYAAGQDENATGIDVKHQQWVDEHEKAMWLDTLYADHSLAAQLQNFLNDVKKFECALIYLDPRDHLPAGVVAP